VKEASARRRHAAPVWLWWSTGKDSAWALRALRADPAFRVTGLVTTVTPAFDRVAIHGTRVSVLRAQADATGLPLRTVELPYPCDNAAYEAAVSPVVEEAVRDGVAAMAFGDLFLEDVREYRERLLDGTGIRPAFPLWGSDTARLARDMIDGGLEACVTCLDPERLPRELAGARFDLSFLDALPDAVDPCGENGEFHTCVSAGPMFEGPIGVSAGEVVERDGFVYADVVPAAAPAEGPGESSQTLAPP
jgi:uncharacterized protein (TIGR00290 family)